MTKGNEPLVIHVGIMGDRPGGIAQVVNQYLSWKYDGLQVIGIASTRGRRDWASPVLLCTALSRILALRVSTGRSAVLVHMSARGSFVREGAVVLWSRFLGHRVGIHLHGSQFPDFSRRRPRLVSLVCRGASVIFVLTDESSEILRQLTSGDKTKIVRLNNVVDIPETTAPKRRIVLFGGEVGHRKGADVLLEAWRRIGVRRGKWELVLAGPQTSQVPPELLTVPGVVNLGPIPHERLLQLQMEAKVAVLPSRNEAMPMFLLESMARGCAIVATPVGQVRELVEGVGDLVEAGNVSELVEVLLNLIGDPPSTEDRGLAARRRVARDFSPEKVRDILATTWAQLARGDIHRG